LKVKSARAYLSNFVTLSAAYGRVCGRFEKGSRQPAGLQQRFWHHGAWPAQRWILQRAADRRQSAPCTTERKFLRGDADILATFFGAHDFRLRWDRRRPFCSSSSGNVRNGGALEFANGNSGNQRTGNGRSVRAPWNQNVDEHLRNRRSFALSAMPKTLIAIVMY
jgi:hypothetical protein